MSETTSLTINERYRPYPAYADSSVDWLGEVPTHWNIERLKYSAPIATNRFAGEAGNTAYIALEHIESWTGKLLSDVSPAEVASNTTTFRTGDVLFGKLRPYLAKVSRAAMSGHCSTELVVLRSNGKIEPDYLAYQLRSAGFIDWLNAMTYGTKMPRANPDQIGNIAIALPPLQEQQAIGRFLDHKTSEIDALIAAKQRLIILLQEKRAALITYAVTKGLDPSVSIKESGVEWLGRIPAHWELRKLRWLMRQIKRPVNVRLDADYQEIGIRSWGKGIFHKEPLKGSLIEGKSVFYVEEGDLVLNIVFAWEGAVATVSKHEMGMIASHRFPTFRHTQEVNLDYLLLFLQSEHGRALMAFNSPGAAGRNKTIRLGQLLSEEIPLPPLDEQFEIVDAFRTEEMRVDELVEMSRIAINRLQEYRTALISAAVTGKIDVRGYAVSDHKAA